MTYKEIVEALREHRDVLEDLVILRKTIENPTLGTLAESIALKENIKYYDMIIVACENMQVHEEALSQPMVGDQMTIFANVIDPNVGRVQQIVQDGKKNALRRAIKEQTGGYCDLNGNCYPPKEVK